MSELVTLDLGDDEVARVFKPIRLSIEIAKQISTFDTQGQALYLIYLQSILITLQIKLT